MNSLEVFESRTPEFVALPPQEKTRRRKLLSETIGSIISYSNKFGFSEGAQALFSLALEIHLTGRVNRRKEKTKIPKK